MLVLTISIRVSSTCNCAVSVKEISNSNQCIMQLWIHVGPFIKNYCQFRTNVSYITKCKQAMFRIYDCALLLYVRSLEWYLVLGQYFKPSLSSVLHTIRHISVLIPIISILKCLISIGYRCLVYVLSCMVNLILKSVISNVHLKTFFEIVHVELI